MSWVKLDDRFFDNPKIAAISDAAQLAHLKAMTYCARELTDGFVPNKKAREYASPKAIKEMAPGLWEPVEDGFMVHDYLQYNPTRQQVLTEREAAKRRMQGVRSPDVRPNNSPNIGRSSPAPLSPSPDPQKREREDLLKRVSDADLDIEPDDGEFYRQYVRHYEKRKATPPSPIEAGEARRLERDYGTAVCVQLAKDYDWQKHPNYMRKALESRRADSGNTVAANSVKPNAAAHTNGLAGGVSDMDKPVSDLAERRRRRTI